MAKGADYSVPFRRRREGKTDYRKRRALVISGLPRLVVRPTNKNIIVQIVEAKPEGDYVLASATSMELRKKFNWKGNCGNLSTAYLTGLLAGFKALEKNIKKAILDIGLKRASKGARVFSAMKGALDAGIEIPHDGKILPEETRIKGEHIAAYAKKLFSIPELYNRCFSSYIEKGLNPQDLPIHFEEVKERIHAQFLSKL
ncbi:MAG: 50S ribosomal protein L18 [Candidatus Bathyarchaeia archaeon]